MTFNDYQETTKTLGIYCDCIGETWLQYLALGLSSEAGEFAEKIKKLWQVNVLIPTTTGDVADLADELGDVLWYLSEAARALGLALDQVAERNLQKLEGRNQQLNWDDGIRSISFGPIKETRCE